MSERNFRDRSQMRLVQQFFKPSLNRVKVKIGANNETTPEYKTLRVENVGEVHEAQGNQRPNASITFIESASPSRAACCTCSPRTASASPPASSVTRLTRRPIAYYAQDVRGHFQRRTAPSILDDRMDMEHRPGRPPCGRTHQQTVGALL